MKRKHKIATMHVLIMKKKVMLLAGSIDLNELPSEFDYDFLDEGGTNPSYCTQPAFRVVRSQCNEQGPSHQRQNDVVATILAGKSTQNANTFC